MKKVSLRKAKKFALSPIAPKNVRGRIGTCVAMEEGLGGGQSEEKQRENVISIAR